VDDDAASTQPVAEEAASPESLLDPEVFAKAPLPDELDRTVALDEQPVLVTRQPGQPTRTYVLPKEQVFAVGRAPGVNTLLVSDPTVSGQHFKLVPKDGDYYVVDLQTTNGTTVNGTPVRAAKLTPGDVIRVGTLEFVYEMKLQRVG
jgi:pSer/pThr/pTyr-binding forkhead associated (FHA) protein